MVSDLLTSSCYLACLLSVPHLRSQNSAWKIHLWIPWMNGISVLVTISPTFFDQPYPLLFAFLGPNRTSNYSIPLVWCENVWVYRVFQKRQNTFVFKHFRWWNRFKVWTYISSKRIFLVHRVTHDCFIKFFLCQIFHLILSQMAGCHLLKHLKIQNITSDLFMFCA